MDEPMAGIDIGAKSEIVGIIRNLSNQGKGVIVVSSELPELLAVSDRIIVMRAGTVDRELSRAELAWYAASGLSSNGDAVAQEEVLNQIIQGVIPKTGGRDQEMGPTAVIASTTAGRDPRPRDVGSSPLGPRPRWSQ
jgi:ABC-type multidrug transport system ATPase subunit